MDALSKRPKGDALNYSCPLTVCQEVPVDNNVLAPQLLGQIASLHKMYLVKEHKRIATPFISFALKQTKKQK